MNKIKFFTMLVMFLFAGMTFVSAQDDDNDDPKKTPAQRLDAHLAKAKKDLQLSDASVEKLRPIFQQTITEIDAVRADKSKKGNAKIDAIKAVITKQNAKVKPLLTAEQYTKFEAEQKKRAEKIQEKRAKKKSAKG